MKFGGVRLRDSHCCRPSRHRNGQHPSGAWGRKGYRPSLELFLFANQLHIATRVGAGEGEVGGGPESESGAVNAPHITCGPRHKLRWRRGEAAAIQSAPPFAPSCWPWFGSE